MTQHYDLKEAVPYRIWGREHIETGAIQQMDRAARLPIARRGALMPDAHVGYGLPIGGVLATENAVIPYAVGVDIACRVRMTIYNTSPHIIDQKHEKLRNIIENNTRFGVGAHWQTPQEHAVMDDPVWRDLAFARARKDGAWQQLGSSGGGNHFVEFGALKVEQQVGRVPPGSYLALLSHSGSRRFGFEAADYYTKIAQDIHRDRLPKDFLHLAWLDLDSDGAEYWQIMELAGRYASANHAIIHQLISAALRQEVLDSVENHHNFAWQETVDGTTAVVHRKGATPAGAGVLGVIPGSMSAPSYIVQGKGSDAGINSAAHGAGRQMSRGEAFRNLDWEQVNHRLKKNNVDLISAGIDEAPHAYKDIGLVMAAQADLVEPLAQFQPRIVKMAPAKQHRDRKRGKKKARDKTRVKEQRKKRR